METPESNQKTLPDIWAEQAKKIDTLLPKFIAEAKAVFGGDDHIIQGIEKAIQAQDITGLHLHVALLANSVLTAEESQSFKEIQENAAALANVIQEAKFCNKEKNLPRKQISEKLEKRSLGEVKNSTKSAIGELGMSF